MTQLAEKCFMPPAAAGVEWRIATSLGMDDDARAALGRITQLSKVRKIGVAGCFTPDRGVSGKLAALGIPENVEPEDFFRFRTIVVPYCGVPARLRREWDEAGQSLEDLTSPQVRRAQVALGLLKMEGAQTLVIGHHEDPETLAISGGSSGTRIIEDTTDSSRLLFAPAFGVVCQTTLSPRRVSWLVQQLRLRWRDARVTFLDTVSPAMVAREEALARLLVVCNRVIVVGEAGESSCQALVETASRRGKQATVVAGPDDLTSFDFTPDEKVALAAGAFATDDAIRAVAAALVAG
jgi:4-hydroxy-3-methylbut-2-enyl diphosphate reductase IspH